jgi:hypothetical protein
MPILPDKDDVSRFICHPDESALGAMERCLDNGLGACFIVDQAGRRIGRLDLEDLSEALKEGKLSVDGCLGGLARRQIGSSAGEADGGGGSVSISYLPQVLRHYSRWALVKEI